MRSRFGLIAGLALASSIAARPVFAGADFGHNAISLPIANFDTVEDRRRRNLAAGGRDKRIKWNKARRSRPARRRSTRYGSPRTSNPFTYQRRKDAFDAALAAGKSRNEAAKLARRA